MRKFSILGAAVFALLVSVSPAAADEQNPALVLTGSGRTRTTTTFALPASTYTIEAFFWPTRHRVCHIHRYEIDDTYSWPFARHITTTVWDGTTLVLLGMHHLRLDTNCDWRIEFRDYSAV